MRVLVCGGRDFTNTEFLYKVLDKFHKEHPIDVIIEGDARGADRMAGYWARRNRVDLLVFPAKWDEYGKSAGYKRNIEMLNQEPDVVIGFDAGKGTTHTLTEARKRKILVIEYLEGRIKNELQ